MDDDVNKSQNDYYANIEQGICPVCGEKLLDVSACLLCYNCGWSACNI